MRLATWRACAAVVLAPIAFMQRLGRIEANKIDTALHDLANPRATIEQATASGPRLPTDAEGLASLAWGDDVTTFGKSCDCETCYGECPGSEPWFENVAITAAFVGGTIPLLRELLVAPLRAAGPRRRA